MKNKEKNNENKVKFTEKFSLVLRRKWLVNGTKTLLIVAILLAAYIALNLWIQTLDLPEIDVTENKIYTLSDASKKAIEKVDQETTIYVYGFDEKTTLVDLLKQYNKANDKIKYEIITEETNLEMVQEHSLQEGYYVLILESGDSEKVIDASSDFYSYDYTTYQQIDTTEQTITNSILALTEENKPKVYFVEGHQEYSQSETQVLTTYLGNEAFEIETLNIATKGQIPDDCDILAILSPNTDILDSEAQAIKDYINRGGNIYFSMDVISETVSLPNLQSVLDEYGVSVKNGYILEYAEDKSSSNYPYIFMPEVSSTSEITADIYTDSYMWLVYSAKLQFVDDDALEALNVTKETLLSSSDESAFITDISSTLQSATQTAEYGSSEIASLVTKTITSTNENGEEETNTSKLIISASGSFISDYTISALSSNYPLSYLGSNKDFVINSLSYLGDKGNTLTIRKDMANSTYTPTETQNRIVLTIIFAVPLVIIFAGIVIWNYRQKRK
jgi:ABC-type uncharacterized transport system involved in gliding motility auxiliary subunit